MRTNVSSHPINTELRATLLLARVDPKYRPPAARCFGNMSLEELNDRLAATPYVAGCTPTSADAALVERLFGNDTVTLQWAARMATYYRCERESIAKDANADGKPPS